ncbi:hypothetical protein H311_00205 [Anncaliia algerae PRA109]|uniref:Transcription initiation factor IIA subunit 2 n=1 Tax=Anncaliia algerae PRA339 TaxID=1288291 RepID=A0A059EY88_9MICR|nr:hypothetical protein H311_00205 [Anncaliia algerae PRA109]KCZ79885.1 hypothetical protein H312_02713 [Anncaliia algerae PRA339]
MYEFYRQSIVGKALQDIIDSMVMTNKLTPSQAKHIIEKFDSIIPQVFTKQVQNNISFKGTVESYNYLDGVWRFLTNEFVMSVNNEIFRSKNLKIVACDADSSSEMGRRRKKKI